MAAVTRVNPTAVARGTIQRLNHQTVYKVVLSGGLAAMASDAAAAKVTDALGSFCSIVQVKSDGSEIYMVADTHSTSLNAITILIAKVLETGTFTTSGGVATLSDASTITVTQPTDLEGM